MEQTIIAVRNELVKNGWVKVTSGAKCNDGAKRNKHVYRKSQPFDEFIIEQVSPYEVNITVPIPFRESSISYKNTFNIQHSGKMHDYVNMHILNNNTKPKY